MKETTTMINKCLSTTCTTTTTTRKEIDSHVDVELSSKRALRAAMLKRRFADTIFKATHRHQSTCNNKKQERELEMEKRRARQKIEAEYRAAKKAAGFVVHSKKTTRENKRAAARIALEKMEKNVYIDDDNAGLLKELEILCGDSVAYQLFYGKGCAGKAKFANPLEKIGLFLKEDSLEDEEDPVLMELEEGEILF